MPKYEPNSRFSDCWSSTGNVTFFHRNDVCYWKRKPQCTFPGTEGQLAVLELHRRALAAWRSLKHQVQLQWNGYAEAAPSHRPPFDGTTGWFEYDSKYSLLELLNDMGVAFHLDGWIQPLEMCNNCIRIGFVRL